MKFYGNENVALTYRYMSLTKITTSWTNYFKRVERVPLEIPRDKTDWDDFKSYLVRKFPYYRLRLQEGDKVCQERCSGSVYLSC